MPLCYRSHLDDCRYLVKRVKIAGDDDRHWMDSIVWWLKFMIISVHIMIRQFTVNERIQAMVRSSIVTRSRSPWSFFSFTELHRNCNVSMNFVESDGFVHRWWHWSDLIAKVWKMLPRIEMTFWTLYTTLNWWILGVQRNPADSSRLDAWLVDADKGHQCQFIPSTDFAWRSHLFWRCLIARSCLRCWLWCRFRVHPNLAHSRCCNSLSTWNLSSGVVHGSCLTTALSRPWR